MLPTEVEREIQRIVEEDLAKWCAAQQQANPHSYVTVAVEFDMRRRITELERAIPTRAERHQPRPVRQSDCCGAGTAAALPTFV